MTKKKTKGRMARTISRKYGVPFALAHKYAKAALRGQYIPGMPAQMARVAWVSPDPADPDWDFMSVTWAPDIARFQG